MALGAEQAKRLQRALTAEGEELFQIFQDTSQEVIRTALKNPRLKEEHLLALLKRRDLSEDILKAVYQHKHAGESHSLKVALAQNPGTSGSLVQIILPQLYTFELLNLCLLAGVTTDQKIAAERVIAQRLPTMPLGNKMTLARRATAYVVGELLKEGDSRLMEACLSNPRLKEAAIFQFLGSSRATAETISFVARHPKWKSRPNLQMAILKNRKTPPIWYTLLLPRLRTSEINQLQASRNLTSAQMKMIRDEQDKRKGRKS